ncbi:MAG TPA: hypothetical protein VEL74_04825 [Thermoanaerobaculia bacterium]|nr:hypothetical protein [Thermoanaerobaculia bacterium]
MKRLALCLFAVVLCLTALATPTQAIPFPPAQPLSCYEACCPVGVPTLGCVHEGKSYTCTTFLREYWC